MDAAIRRSLSHDGTAVVVVAGEVDFTNADQMSTCIEAAVADGRPRAVRVDLAEATFIDSTGLGALIAGYRAAAEADCDFAVVRVRPGFHKVLVVTGLCELFGLPTTRDSDIVS